MVIVCFIHAKRNKYLYLKDNAIMSTANKLCIWLLQIVLAGLPFRILQKFLGHCQKYRLQYCCIKLGDLWMELCRAGSVQSVPRGSRAQCSHGDPAVWGRALPRPGSHTGRSAFSRNPCAGCSSHIRWTELCVLGGRFANVIFFLLSK